MAESTRRILLAEDDRFLRKAAETALKRQGLTVLPAVDGEEALRVARAETPDVVKVPIDPKNWDIITDAMANVPTPLGTAGSAHLQGIDFAGKTGSAQTISNQLKAKLVHGKTDYKDNAWFVGVTPRRNPEVVVAVLFEGGEHGQFAARIAAQVIKAYVEKQRRLPNKVAQKDNKVDVGALWNTPNDDDGIRAGHFELPIPKKAVQLATAAPGVN